MDQNNKKDSFLKGALILGIAGLVVKVLGAFFRIPLGNFIGAEGMGYYQAAYPVYTLFLTLATAGFPTALAKLVAEKIAIDDYSGANKIFKVSYIILFITGFISFCIFLFGAEFIVNDVMHNPNAYYSMIAIAPSLLFVPVMAAYRGYFQGRREMKYIAVSQIVEQTFRVIVGLVLAYILMQKLGPKFGAAGAIVGATIGAFVSIGYLAIQYMLNKKKLLNENTNKKYDEEKISKILKQLLVVAIPITIGASVMPLVNMVDNVVVIRQLEVAGFTNASANQLFGQLTGMAMSIVNMPTIITLSIGMSLVPAISELTALKQTERVKIEILTAVKVTLYILLPAAVGLAVLATPIMKLLYSAEPASLGMIMLSLTPCVVFLGLMQTLNGILQGIGKPMVPVIGLLIGIVFKIGLTYTLTAMPEINIYGAAIGTVVAYLIAVVFELWYIRKHVGVKFPIKDIFIKPISMVVIMGVVVKLSYVLLVGMIGGKLSTVVSIGIGALIYLVVVFALGGITKDELIKLPKGEKVYKLLNKIKIMK